MNRRMRIDYLIQKPLLGSIVMYGMSSSHASRYIVFNSEYGIDSDFIYMPWKTNDRMLCNISERYIQLSKTIST